MNIQWYPGHMAKARRQLQEDLKLIDVVVEVTDARAPAATRNPDFDDLFRGKLRLVILNKSDLADPAMNRAWVSYYKKQGIEAGAVVSTAGESKKRVLEMITQAAAPKVEAMKKKGVNKVVRVMVVGIPNAGKSTLINRVAGSKRAQVGDKPGVTKSKQWVRISPFLELMDTPGLLWPKLEIQEQARHLAYIGSINDDIMDSEELAGNLLRDLLAICPDALHARYPSCAEGMTIPELLGAVCNDRKFILSGGEYDTERAARVVLDEFRAGKVAHVTLEQPGEDLNGKDS